MGIKYGPNPLAFVWLRVQGPKPGQGPVPGRGPVPGWGWY